MKKLQAALVGLLMIPMAVVAATAPAQPSGWCASFPQWPGCAKAV